MYPIAPNYDLVKPFGIKDERLYIGNISVNDLTERYDTPTFYVSGDRFEDNIKEYEESFRQEGYNGNMFTIAYAIKAHTNLALLKFAKNRGTGFDVSYKNELYAALNTGISPDKIFFNGNAKKRVALIEAIERGVMINIDNLMELDEIIDIQKRLGKKARISIRVNPEIDVDTDPAIATAVKNSKFGLNFNLAEKAYKLAISNNMDVKGVHMHLGSQITNMSVFKEGTTKFVEFAKHLEEELGLEFELLNFGGGLGISYAKTRSEEEKIVKNLKEINKNEDIHSNFYCPISKRDYVKNIVDSVSILNHDVKIVIEPGRSLIGDACILVGRVMNIKEGSPDIVSLDMGANLVLENIIMKNYNNIIIANKARNKSDNHVKFVGNLCYAGDFVSPFGWEMPDLKKGDLVSLMDAGAYHWFFACHGNSVEFPATVLVYKDKEYLIRKRERYDDVFANDVDLDL